MANTIELDRRAVLGVLGGAAMASAGTCLRRVPREGESDGVAVWVADRDGDRLVGLSASLARCVEVHVPCPLAVATAREHGVWVLCGRRRTAADPARTLELVDERGRRRVVAELREAGALRRGEDGAVWLLTRGGRSLVCFEPGGSHRALALPERATAFALHPRGEVIVAAQSGALVSGSTREDGRWEHATCPERFPLDVAPHPEGWWVLARDRIVRLDRALEVQYAVALREGAGRLAAVDVDRSSGHGVWHLAARGASLAHFAPGEPRVLTGGVRIAGVSKAAALGDDGVVAVSPGAVLAFDRRGRPRPGQSGFRHLVDVATAR